MSALIAYHTSSTKKVKLRLSSIFLQLQSLNKILSNVPLNFIEQKDYNYEENTFTLEFYSQRKMDSLKFKLVETKFEQFNMRQVVLDLTYFYALSLTLIK